MPIKRSEMEREMLSAELWKKSCWRRSCNMWRGKTVVVADERSCTGSCCGERDVAAGVDVEEKEIISHAVG